MALNSWLHFRLGCRGGIREARQISAMPLTGTIVSPPQRSDGVLCLAKVAVFGTRAEASVPLVSAVREHGGRGKQLYTCTKKQQILAVT